MSILKFPHQQTNTKLEQRVKQLITLSKQLLKTPISHTKQQSIFHQQTLRSSFFSARIEGNTLTLNESKNLVIRERLDKDSKKIKEKEEVSNVVKALNNIDKLPDKLTTKDVQNIHKQILCNLDPQAGKIRTKGSGIFDELGNIVYLTPEEKETRQMLGLVIKNINSSCNLNIVQQLINLSSCHYYFEKTHPFIDGNGRVGRVLLQYQLRKTKLFANYILPIDEYFEKNRSSYYFYLEKNTRNIAEFSEFILDALIFTTKQLILDISKDENTTSNLLEQLLPRRKELFYITKDHPYISLDSLSRRFPTIPKRTIAYDINFLVKKNYLVKHGQTRGARYSVSR